MKDWWGDGEMPDGWKAAPSSKSILREAERLVHGPRQEAYGHPTDDFTRTGRMWGAILGTDDVPPELVGLCMVALKLSREVNQHNDENLIDGAGYLETVRLVWEATEERIDDG